MIKEETLTISTSECFECGAPAEHMHHLMPRSKGGTQVIPVCNSCHSKIHDAKLISTSELTKAGIRKAQARGVHCGRPVAIKDIGPIIKRRLSGMSYGKIGKELGIPRQSVQRYFKKWLTDLSDADTPVSEPDLQKEKTNESDGNVD